MDVITVKQMKKDLEKNLLNIVRAFEKETGTAVECIEVLRTVQKTVASGRSDHLTAIEIDVAVR